MKTLSLIFALSLSLSAFAQIHADETIEKACYEQATKIGCARNGQEPDQACTRKNKAKLTKTCHPLLGVQ